MDAPIRIMSVDDNKLVREALERRFTATEGFEWCGALPDAKGLLARAREWRADLILLDLEMPGPDPFAAIRRLARHLPGAKVVVLSGSVTPGLVAKALSAGACGFLSKADEVRAMVEVAHEVAAGKVQVGPEVRAVCGPLSAEQRQAAPSGSWSRVARMFRTPAAAGAR